MALKTTLNKDPKPTSTGEPDVKQVESEGESGILLELALYKNYTCGTGMDLMAYEAGKAYRFTQETAMALLSEQDHGRPIWRIYRPARVKTHQASPVVDATRVQATRTRQTVDQVLNPPDSGKKRIEVGDDAEIADLLPKDDADSGDVIV